MTKFHSLPCDKKRQSWCKKLVPHLSFQPLISLARVLPVETTVKKRILVAEDNVDMAIVMRQLLESLGYEATSARDGLEAVEMATAQLPDLIIMDVTLPKIDGLQAASRIQENPKT